ncbi:ABC transporter substrate-binding protein [Natrialba sp. SSL1]|uniref:ABC transporter substrate-binding protein n=1 Tax=Natrialba sp. SSL1 TaxID=1869245 RepID=UPI00209B7153|nr:PotD/PotF family extracellular solute-binding protein [Natrialba sp. SSL1]
MNRRSFLATTGVATTIGLAGCLGGDDDYIRYLGWGGNTQDSAAEIFEQWSEESGVEVRHESAGGDVEFISYLQQNEGEVDLFLPSSYGIHLARQEDLLADVDYGEVPNYEENMMEDWQDMPYIDGDAFFRDALTQGYSVNTEDVDQEMATWDDIKDDQFDESLALRDDAASRFTNAALSIGEDVNQIPDDDGLFDDVVAEIEEQHENAFSLWGAGAEAMQYLREENAMVSEAWGGRTRALQQDGYEHIEYVIPDEGAATITEDYAIPAASEKKETVYELLDFAYERDNLVDISDMLGYPVPVVDTPDVITDLPDYVSDPDDLAWVDWSVVDPVIDDWQETFDEIK